MCPPGKAIVLGMFQDGELWTAFIARRRAANFDVIAGPDELRREMGLLAGDWRRDYRHLVRSVEERIARQNADYEALNRLYEKSRDAQLAAGTRADLLASELGTANSALAKETGQNGGALAGQPSRMTSGRCSTACRKPASPSAAVCTR